MKNTHAVIVTGASGGLGLSVTKAWLDRGYHVIGTALTAESLEEAAKTLGNSDNFHTIAGDIGLQETADTLFRYAESAGLQVEILINNAGIFIPKPVVDYTGDDIRNMLDINLRGFIYPSQAAVRHMRRHGGGQIIAITAAIAMQPNVKTPALLPVLTKGGLNQAVRALAIELADDNIRVNAVAPGIIRTPMHASDEQTQAILKTLSPMKQTGKSDDITNAVLYLADADYVTGTIMPVDGGTSAGVW